MRVYEFYEVIKINSDPDYREPISVAKFITKQAANEMVGEQLQNPLEKWRIETHTHLIYFDLSDYKSKKSSLDEIKQQALAKLDPLERKALGLN